MTFLTVYDEATLPPCCMAPNEWLWARISGLNKRYECFFLPGGRCVGPREIKPPGRILRPVSPRVRLTSPANGRKHSNRQLNGPIVRLKMEIFYWNSSWSSLSAKFPSRTKEGENYPGLRKRLQLAIMLITIAQNKKVKLGNPLMEIVIIVPNYREEYFSALNYMWLNI